jgi:hypothetical protein
MYDEVNLMSLVWQATSHFILSKKTPGESAGWRNRTLDLRILLVFFLNYKDTKAQSANMLFGLKN